ncbi:MAG: PQ-loop repeat-containing protein [Candidatus Uhrbacteria bacterium]|nr:PQ-loop repeat-containing protein [Candidatus Uhrbacteria bacterium]
MPYDQIAHTHPGASKGNAPSYAQCITLIDKMFKNLLETFADVQHHHFIDYLANINSGISAVALFPQLYTTIIDQSTDGLSGISFFLIAFNSIIWVIYGIHRHTPALIISSTLNVIASVTILAFIIT